MTAIDIDPKSWRDDPVAIDLMAASEKLVQPSVAGAFGCKDRWFWPTIFVFRPEFDVATGDRLVIDPVDDGYSKLRRATDSEHDRVVVSLVDCPAERVAFMCEEEHFRQADS